MEFLKKNKSLILLLFVALLCLYFSIGKISNILIDIGREMYYPKAILGGKVLYKDLFCIYGPLSYQINALFYKILGAKLSTLYFLGSLSALGAVGLIYKISKKFLSEYLSIIITLFVIVTGCLSTRIFNFTLPYSYAVIYGLLSFLVSIYFLIEYNENKKQSFLITSSLFGGAAFLFKYDFILYAVPLFISIFYTKNLKLILKSFLAFLLPSVLSFGVLFISGLNFSDLIFSIKAIKDFSHTKAMESFYLTQGVYYTNRIWHDWFLEIFKLSIGFVFIILGVYFQDKKFFPRISIWLGVFLIYLFSGIESYLYLTFVVTLFFILTFKKNTNIENLFVLSAILISIKSLWGISHSNYGLYYIGVILISFFILLKNNSSPLIQKSFCYVLIGLLLSYFVQNINGIIAVDSKLDVNSNLKTERNWAISTNELLDFINNTKEDNPNIMVFPEGLAINFLSNKENEAKGFYNSLIPLYIEGFGEDKIIKYYSENKPDYIIFSNMPQDSYGKGEICNTYAKSFCNFVFENYEPVKKIKNFGASFLVFMLKS